MGTNAWHPQKIIKKQFPSRFPDHFSILGLGLRRFNSPQDSTTRSCKKHITPWAISMDIVSVNGSGNQRFFLEVPWILFHHPLLGLLQCEIATTQSWSSAASPFNDFVAKQLKVGMGPLKNGWLPVLQETETRKKQEWQLKWIWLKIMHP